MMISRAGALQSYDRTVRDREDFVVKIEYMKKNPVKAGLAARAEEWDALWINERY